MQTCGLRQGEHPEEIPKCCISDEFLLKESKHDKIDAREYDRLMIRIIKYGLMRVQR